MSGKSRTKAGAWLIYGMLLLLILYCAAYFTMMQTTGFFGMSADGWWIEAHPVYVWGRRDMKVGRQDICRFIFAPARSLHLLAKSVWYYRFPP